MSADFIAKASVAKDACHRVLQLIEQHVRASQNRPIDQIIEETKRELESLSKTLDTIQSSVVVPSGGESIAPDSLLVEATHQIRTISRTETVLFGAIILITSLAYYLRRHWKDRYLPHVLLSGIAIELAVIVHYTYSNSSGDYGDFGDYLAAFTMLLPAFLYFSLIFNPVVHAILVQKKDAGTALDSSPVEKSQANMPGKQLTENEKGM